MEKSLKTYWQMFFSFLKIGAFTLGGGYAMIPLVREEVVKHRRWIEEEEFLNMLALAQSAPGVMAVNTAIFVGYKIHGWKGMICTTLGSILPSFVIILLIATLFTHFREYPLVEAAFKGIRPAVVALIAAPLYKMAKNAGMMRTDCTKSKKELIGSWILLLLPIAVALLIWLADLSPIVIIVLTILSALTITFVNDRKERKNCR